MPKNTRRNPRPTQSSRSRAPQSDAEVTLFLDDKSYHMLLQLADYTGLTPSEVFKQAVDLLLEKGMRVDGKTVRNERRPLH